MIAEVPDQYIEAPKATTFQQSSEGDNVLHYVALPDGKTSIDPVDFPKEPLLQYDFELDEFQKTAVACVHRNESVLVSAHTSAGKTAIALYAIQSAINSNSRVIYTSPIKALSNQKYRELKEQFGEVGLITGDVTVNSSAPILVMTTEILRMMLYRGDSLIHELSWVIYDEIHYMKDPERGVVWEESIIMLPDSVHFVFLSATIPNAREFSEWISSIHHQPCHVVYTNHRPTPLKFYISSNGSEAPALIKEGEGPLDTVAVHTAYSKVKPEEDKSIYKGISVTKLNSGESKPVSRQTTDKLCAETAAWLVTHDQAPLIVFAFGRKLCDDLPTNLNGKSFVTQEESEQINQMIDVAIEKLEDSEKELPQIQTMRNLLVRGIGVHHGGLIPLLKELIELLFQYGLLKILFATETFAMGLNMPARSVLFHSLFKFDGDKRRLLTSSEFIQMSGRAGRRNNDRFGNVILTCTGEPQERPFCDLLTGIAQPLNSEFHVTYHMLLSLLTSRMMAPELLMKRSFHQFQMEREEPLKEKERDDYARRASEIQIKDENKVKQRVVVEDSIEKLKQEKRDLEMSRECLNDILVLGRVVEVGEFGYGIVAAGFAPKRKDLEIFVAIAGKKNKDGEIVPDPPLRQDSTIFHMKMDANQLTAITDFVIDVHRMTNDGGLNYAFSKLLKAVNQHKVNKKDWSFVMNNEEKRKKYEKLNSQLEKLNELLPKLQNVPKEDIQLYRKKQDLQELSKMAAERCNYLKKAVMQRDLQEMKLIIEKLGFVDSEGIITDKGRVASVITAGDELVMTELLFSGLLNELTSQQIASLMCSFATDEGAKDEPEIPDEMKMPWEKLKDICERVYNVMLECGRNEPKEKWMGKFDGTYVSLTFNWAAGASFKEIMEENPDTFEGGVIRTMKRTEEILRQAQRAAAVMGSPELELKILDAITKIKRDIVFAASLYL
ncbi:RNA helicase protein [Trichomonas vaginalis G3]|uniref:RNA helicase protein n=1 Tax=Trichomonas vaginalis (strain ATCC PRA-98 / G3) TaxID=412133 RepID=UPI0021E5F9BC|nr:RNA helicase protein [Trichomonas vaginalis G3]KAI5523659.1 RNA helicase protein [Trichomonas vaginalis G3]